MPPKGSGKAAQAAAAAAAAAAATASATSTTASTPKQSRVVTLKLSSSSLSKFPHDAVSSTKSSSSSAKNSPPPDVKDESSKPGTPAPGTERKKPGPPKGTKRKSEALLPDGTPKPRGKPGPKKRKLDGTDADGRPWTTPAAGVGAHKLGPKANMGAINAGLRALDRTGKPCRKWTRKAITLKSFTGQVWNMPTWGAPRRPRAEGEEDSTSGTPEANGNGENKENGDGDGDGEGKGGPGLTPAPSSDAGRITPAADGASAVGTPVMAAA